MHSTQITTMAKLKIFPLSRIAFHLFLASLAMTLAISYCTNLTSLLIRHDDAVGFGLAGLLFSYFMLSLFFYVFAGKWIVRNFSGILWIYCTTSLLFSFGDLINYASLPNLPFKNFTEFIFILLACFIAWLIQLLPLISLIATPTLVISSILTSLKNSTLLQENSNI
jgi:hypothetical protein